MTAQPDETWQRVLPPSVRTGSPQETTVPVHVPHGTSVVVVVAGGDGAEEFLTQVEDNTPPRDVDGVLTGRARFALGALEPGEYVLRATLEDGSDVTTELVVTEEEPAAAGPDPGWEGLGRAEYHGRNWGLSAALYAVRSTSSWGIGDLADLADFAVIVADAGGDYVLLTSLARNASDAVQALGYTAERRGGLVIDPVYVRPEDIREVAYLPSSQRTMLDWSSETIRATNREAEAINLDEVWEAKRAALEVIHGAARSPLREASFQRFARDYGRGLAEYVHAAVAADTGGGEGLYGDLCADSTTGAAARKEHQERIDFFLWLQWVAREQLARAQAGARAAGMRVGLVHTAPAAADPGILAEISPYAGGVYLTDASIDGADLEGASLEGAVQAASDAGVLLIADGRDPQARESLVGAGVFAHTTVWAEFDDDDPRDLAALPPQTMLSVALTEDPPTAGVLAEEHLALRSRLGLLEGDLEDLRRQERIRRERLIGKVQAAGLITGSPTERQLIEGLHAYLARGSARLLTVTLSDAVGNRRPFALGGTYPDWSLPYTDGAGEGVLLDDLPGNARFASLLAALDTALRGDEE